MYNLILPAQLPLPTVLVKKGNIWIYEGNIWGYQSARIWRILKKYLTDTSPNDLNHCGKKQFIKVWFSQIVTTVVQIISACISKIIFPNSSDALPLSSNRVMIKPCPATYNNNLYWKGDELINVWFLPEYCSTTTLRGFSFKARQEAARLGFPKISHFEQW